MESKNGRRSAIVITIRNNKEASRLFSKGLRFREALKVVEKFWEAGPGSVYISCASLGHDRLEECVDRAVQCINCSGAHKVKNHRCGITGFTLKMGKICTHIKSKCASCEKNHSSTEFRYPARPKAQAEAWKEKVKKSQAKKKQSATHVVLEKEPAIEPSKMELDTVLTLWAKSPRQQSLDLTLFNEDSAENVQDK